MHVPLPYSKQQVVAAFDNVLILAHDQADMNHLEGFTTSDDIICWDSIKIVKHVRNMINDTPDTETDLQE